MCVCVLIFMDCWIFFGNFLQFQIICFYMWIKCNAIFHDFFLHISLFYIYIYIYAFSRRFLSKATYIAFKLQFYILSALAFPGNRTHDLGVASAMLYHLSYRKAIHSLQNFVCFPSLFTDIRRSEELSLLKLPDDQKKKKKKDKGPESAFDEILTMDMAGGIYCCFWRGFFYNEKH